jgi:hypothetical protein
MALQSGTPLLDAKLSWKAYGTLSAARDNVIVYSTSYSAQHIDQHIDQEWSDRPGRQYGGPFWGCIGSVLCISLSWPAEPRAVAPS